MCKRERYCEKHVASFALGVTRLACTAAPARFQGQVQHTPPQPTPASSAARPHLHRGNLLLAELAGGEQAGNGGVHNGGLLGRTAGEGVVQPLAQLWAGWELGGSVSVPASRQRHMPRPE